MPVATVFENLEAGSSIEEIIEQFHVTREQIQAVLDFVARSLDQNCPQPIDSRLESDLAAGLLDKAIHRALDDEESRRVRKL
jgi:hypothetical protein